MTLSITIKNVTLSIMTLSLTIKNVTLSITTFNIMPLEPVILSVTNNDIEHNNKKM